MTRPVARARASSSSARVPTCPWKNLSFRGWRDRARRAPRRRARPRGSRCAGWTRGATLPLSAPRDARSPRPPPRAQPRATPPSRCRGRRWREARARSTPRRSPRRRGTARRCARCARAPPSSRDRTGGARPPSRRHRWRSSCPLGRGRSAMRARNTTSVVFAIKPLIGRNQGSRTGRNPKPIGGLVRLNFIASQQREQRASTALGRSGAKKCTFWSRSSRRSPHCSAPTPRTMAARWRWVSRPARCARPRTCVRRPRWCQEASRGNAIYGASIGPRASVSPLAV